MSLMEIDTIRTVGEDYELTLIAIEQEIHSLKGVYFAHFAGHSRDTLKLIVEFDDCFSPLRYFRKKKIRKILKAHGVRPICIYYPKG